MLLNILEAEAPLAPAAPPPAVPILAGGKGPAVGKADGKAKPAGKGKADAGPPVPIAPPAELVPPFPASSQLPAVQCLQVRQLLVLSGLSWAIGCCQMATGCIHNVEAACRLKACAAAYAWCCLHDGLLPSSLWIEAVQLIKDVLMFPHEHQCVNMGC